MTKKLPATTSSAQNKPALAFYAKAEEFLRKLSGSRVFQDDLFYDDAVINEAEDKTKYNKLANKVRRNTYFIVALSAFIVFAAPVMKPRYSYEARSPEYDIRIPEKNSMPLVPLFLPNMTHEAVLSWAATTITEIMTLGFGDFDKQIVAQRDRFTESGWISFLIAMREGGMRDNFKERQLILTTVPADSPMVVAEGEDKENIYQWQIEMPVIMNFATNNNVTKKERAIIKLTIVRVPGKENMRGIAIKAWNLS